MKTLQQTRVLTVGSTKGHIASVCGRPVYPFSLPVQNGAVEWISKTRVLFETKRRKGPIYQTDGARVVCDKRIHHLRAWCLN